MNRCDVCGGDGMLFEGADKPFLMLCPDSGVVICGRCMVWPGIFGGIDHHMPDSPEWCAHRHKDDPTRPATIRFMPADAAKVAPDWTPARPPASGREGEAGGRDVSRETLAESGQVVGYIGRIGQLERLDQDADAAVLPEQRVPLAERVAAENRLIMQPVAVTFDDRLAGDGDG